jgi:hypothetical protein
LTLSPWYTYNFNYGNATLTSPKSSYSMFTINGCDVTAQTSEHTLI